MVHIKRINEMTDFMNEGLLSAIKARAQIVKVQGWFFDTAAQAIADNPKKYRKAEQLVDALESDARKEYKKVVTVEDALTFNDWWGDFRKSAINALERNFEQSMNESYNRSGTPVIIRREDDGQLVAFFPEQINGKYIGCYSHIGQHSDASVDYMLNDTSEVSENDAREVSALISELQRIGYENIHIVKADDFDINAVRESASPYDSEAEGKRIWNAVISGRENTLPRTSREDACKCLATYFSNFNEFNAPPAEDISRLVNWLEATYSNTDAQNEEGVAKFISSLWRHFSYKGRAFSNIIRNYQSMHPTSSLGERIALGRKFDR